MRKRSARFGAALLGIALGLSFTQCKQAASEDDSEAGASGQGGSSNGGAGGAQGGTSSAGLGGGGAAGSGAASGAGATGGAAATGGTGGTAATGGSGNAAGKPSAAGSSAGGASSGACDEVVAVRPPAPAAVDEATFTAQWPALVCAAMKPCCGTEAPAYDEAKCLAYAPTALDKTDKKYDGVAAGSCLESLTASAAKCPGPTSYRGLPQTCSLVYRGTLALGTECETPSECAPDPRGPVTCALQTSTCTVEIRGKLGDPCNEGCEIQTDTGICYPQNDPLDPAVIVTCHDEDGLYCVYGGESGTPGATVGTCQPALGLGCECLYADQKYCNGQTRCTDGSDGSDSICKARVGAGAPCVLNFDCTIDNYCDRDAEPSICVARKHASEPCTDHDQCYGGYCWTSVCVLDNGESRGNFHDIYCDGVGTDD